MSTRYVEDLTGMLIDKTYNILEWKIYYAMNEKDKLPEGYLNFDHKMLDEVVRITSPLLKNAQLTKKLNAESTQSILKQLNSGKITTDEALKLMALSKSQLELKERQGKLDIQERISDLVSKM